MANLEDVVSTEITPKDYMLLDAFTKYELGKVEQSYLVAMKSSLNGRHIATTSTHLSLLNITEISSMITQGAPTFVNYIVEEELIPQPYEICHTEK